jgi:acyloxyacyl hydrolase
MSGAVFENLLQIAENELDWPSMSTATGFTNNTWAGHPIGNVDSAYLRNRARNLCSHRDYQNIAVNGARSGAMTNIVKTMARNQTFDQPAFVTYALIGNGNFCDCFNSFLKMCVLHMKPLTQ